MAEWESRSIEELVSSVSSGGTPRAGDPRYYSETGIPFLKIDDMTKSDGRFVDRAEQSITPLALKESAAKLFSAGTVLVTMYGTMGVVKTLRAPMATNQAIAALIPPFRCDPTYLAHALSFRRPELERLAVQTTQPNLSGTIIRRFRLPLPPLENQRRIAEILDTIDEAIKATERVIAKDEGLRSGLATRLLSRNTDMTEWRACQLRDLGTVVGGGTPSRERPEYWSGTIPWLTPGELTGNGDKYVVETLECISELGLGRSGAKLVPAGSLLVTSRASIGFCALAGKPIATNQGFKNLIPGDGVDPSYLFHLGRTLGREMKRRASGTTFLEIAGREFGRIIVRLPLLQEQRRIAKILDTADEKIRADERQRDKLQRLRSGLVADLMSGRVRTVAA